MVHGRAARAGISTQSARISRQKPLTWPTHCNVEMGPHYYIAKALSLVRGIMMSRRYVRFIALVGLVFSTFLIGPVTASVSAGVGYGVVIVTTENGQPVTDVCYVLVDFSNVGCDKNADGQVKFDKVPPGTYTVHQTADLGPHRHVADFQITTTTTGGGIYEFFNATVINDSTTVSPNGSVNISLITRDPDSGKLLTGACYILENYSNVGCDENLDGQVDFAAIPFGTYTVHQTKAPQGYDLIIDYEISVDPVGVPTGFVVQQAARQYTPGTRNVSFVLVDVTTGKKVVGDTCIQIVNASNVGCDDDLKDGQIDFLDVPGGDHAYRFTQLPAGYVAIQGPDGGFISIDTTTSRANVIVYVGLKPTP